jgi:uncharacterized membrane protein
MTLLGQTHLVTAFAAIAAGAAVLLVRPKGARWHRRLGWLYATSMLVLNVTALMIYRLFGGFGPFHAAAIVSLVGLLLGVHAARRGRRARLAHSPAERATWVQRHYYWMTWSYVGLLAAFASETITRLPALRPVFGGGRTFGIAVGVATLVIVGIGSRWIKRSATASLAPYTRARP